MESILPIIIGLVIIFVLFKVAKGIIKTIGTMVILAAVLAFIYFNGGLG